jgi:NAD(P)-dependent dehydrogenase (short-subunit alcohol dehydrogenase family)
MTREEWNWQVETNVTRAFLHSRETMKAMIPDKAGAIVNIASYASYEAPPCASSASILGSSLRQPVKRRQS